MYILHLATQLTIMTRRTRNCDNVQVHSLKKNVATEILSKHVCTNRRLSRRETYQTQLVQ